MSTARIIIKNTGILFLGEVISRLLSFFLIIIIARHLGDVGLGKYSFVFAFVGIFSIFSDFGTNTYMIRELSRDRSLAVKYFGNAFIFKLAVSTIAILLPVIFIFLTRQPQEIKIGILLAAVSMFAYYMIFPFKAILTAFEVQSYQSLYLISERVIAFILGAFVLYKGYGLLTLLIVLVMSNVTSWILLYKLVSKNIVKLKPEFDFIFIKSFIKNSFPFWFTIVFMTIYFKIDTVMLSFLKGYAATGWYNASYKIIDALSFIPFIVITAVFPVMSKFYAKKHKLLHLLYEKSFYYLSLLAMPLGLGITLLANRIILFVYNKEFINSVIALQILIWALVLIYINYLMGYLLNSIDKQKLFTLTTGISVILNILLNFILIPIYSFKGAAIATVATEIVNFIMLFNFTSKNGHHINLFRMIYKPFVATIIMGIFLINLSRMHLLILIPLSMLIYFVAILLMGGIMKDDIKILLSFVKKQE